MKLNICQEKSIYVYLGQSETDIVYKYISLFYCKVEGLPFHTTSRSEINEETRPPIYAKKTTARRPLNIE